MVAIKVLNLDTEEEDVSDIQREIATLSQLKNCDSQNITRYHGSFLNGTKLWIVMDYAAGGSIRSLVREGTRIKKNAKYGLRDRSACLVANIEVACVRGRGRGRGWMRDTVNWRKSAI